ncbi:MAG TPA: alpha/beta fold hydrolase [Kofleriaceae bacterium]
MRRGFALALTSLTSLVTGCGSPPGASPADAAAPAPDAPADAAAAAHGPYPIVLAHGLFGFTNIGPLDYFYGVAPVLEAQGRTVVANAVDPVQSSDVRGAQLVADIEQVRAQTGAAKVIIIGHSQGGLDARWAASHDPDAVAAVITIATPHRGSPVADVALGLAPGDAQAALDAIADLFGLSGTSFEGALQDLSTAGAAAFNAATPDAPNVMYWSVAGRSNQITADDCPPSSTITSAWDNSVDTMDPVLSPVDAILAAAVAPATPVQDGLVTLDSAQWGRFLGCVPADHFDEVCQIAGESPGIGNDFACLQLYENLGNLLTANDL